MQDAPELLRLQRCGPNDREQEDHALGTQLMVLFCRWSAIFTVIHWLGEVWEMLEEGREKAPGWECPCFHRKMQLFL